MLHLLCLLRRRSVQVSIAGWAAVNVLLVTMAGDHLPFHASSLARPPTVQAVLTADGMFVEVFALMALGYAMTRRRDVPDLSERAPDRSRARAKVFGMLAYAAVALCGGFLLGRTLGWQAFSFHLDNMVIRTGQPVMPAEALCWAGYNLIAYVAIPLLVFRRRYTS